VKSSERIRRNVGHLAFGLLGAVLLWMAWRSLQYENWRSAVLIVALSLSLLWGVLASRYEPDWRAEMPPPSSLLRTVVSCALWLGIGTMMAMPEFLLPSGVVSRESGPLWLRVVLLALVTLPALALAHVQFLSRMSEPRKAKARWGIERLGPIGACTYFLAGES